MIFDFAGVTPNPARDKVAVKLPREDEGARSSRRPPSTSLAVHALLPSRYRLPLLVLDATGMRLGELEGLTWGDVDEPRGPLARLGGRVEDEPRALGERAARRCSRPCCGARAARRPHS